MVIIMDDEKKATENWDDEGLCGFDNNEDGDQMAESIENCMSCDSKECSVRKKYFIAELVVRCPACGCEKLEEQHKLAGLFLTCTQCGDFGTDDHFRCPK
jgi:hypothetical protein